MKFWSETSIYLNRTSLTVKNMYPPDSLKSVGQSMREYIVRETVDL